MKTDLLAIGMTDEEYQDYLIEARKTHPVAAPVPSNLLTISSKGLRIMPLPDPMHNIPLPPPED